MIYAFIAGHLAIGLVVWLVMVRFRWDDGMPMFFALFMWPGILVMALMMCAFWPLFWLEGKIRARMRR